MPTGGFCIFSWFFSFSLPQGISLHFLGLFFSYLSFIFHCHDRMEFSFVLLWWVWRVNTDMGIGWHTLALILGDVFLAFHLYWFIDFMLPDTWWCAWCLRFVTFATYLLRNEHYDSHSHPPLLSNHEHQQQQDLGETARSPSKLSTYQGSASMPVWNTIPTLPSNRCSETTEFAEKPD